MTDSDGINETWEGVERVVLVTAARMGETIMRIRRELLEQARARDAREAAQLQAIYDSRRALARAELRGVEQDSWWDRATPDDVARAWTVARTWREDDPEIRAVDDRITREVQDRYGFDPADTSLPTAQGIEASARITEARAGVLRAQSEAAQDAAEAQVLLAESYGLQRLADSTRERVSELEAGIDWERGGVDDVERFVQVEAARQQAAGYERDADVREARATQLQAAGDDVTRAADERAAAARLQRESDVERHEAQQGLDRAAAIEEQAQTLPEPERAARFEDAQAVRAQAHDRAAAADGKADQAQELYGSADRRERFAEDLRSRGHSDTAVRDRMVPETDHATHPREAVRRAPRAPGRGSKPARTLDQGRDRDRGRGR